MSDATTPAGSAKIEELRREVEESPESARAHLRLGTALLPVSTKQAEAELRRAVELDAECVEAWVNLGGILMQRRDFAGCVDANARAVALRPDSLAGHFNKGLGHLYLNQAEEMVASFAKVVEIDPRHAAGHYHIAVGLLALGHVQQAQQRLKMSTDLGHSPQPEFIRELEKQLKSDTGSAAQVDEIGPGGADHTKQ